jgi:hypothetical protein
MPSFGGPATGPASGTGSQNLHGGDGPSVGDPSPAAAEASGTDSAAGTGQLGTGNSGLLGTGSPDPLSSGSSSPLGSGNAGQVAVPPAAAPDQRLPIYDSLESDWFRSSGKPVGTQRAAPVSAGAKADQTAVQPAWVSPADEGWRAAKALAVPAAGDTTQAGLPRRVPRANLVPGSVGGGADTEAEAPARSADAVRNRMASFQRGVREGRAASPQTEEP